MSGAPLTLVGYPVSPFVRKARMVLAIKGVAYALDPLVPFTERDRLAPLNPKGTVPVLLTPEGPLPDSGAIVAWIDARWPDPAILPTDAAGRARAEEAIHWAESALARVFGGGVLFQRVVSPFYKGRSGDAARVARTVADDGPAALSDLSARLGGDDWIAGSFGLADIAVFTWLHGAAIAGYPLDAQADAATRAWLQRVSAHPAVAEVLASEGDLDVLAWAAALPPLGLAA